MKRRGAQYPLPERPKMHATKRESGRVVFTRCGRAFVRAECRSVYYSDHLITCRSCLRAMI